MARSPELARRLWWRLEPIHNVTYFSPEPITALKEAGYKGFWMGYFAGRAAPLGPVSADIVTATFYNFSPTHVGRAIPDAWSFAPPDAALEARQRGSVAALTRAFEAAGVGDSDPDAAQLARRAAESAPLEGRALYAANRSLPWPDDPVAALWHAATLLREHRGDGHVAALTAAAIGGREANVLQVAAGLVTRDVIFLARQYDDAEWEASTAGLTDRGLLGEDGALSTEGEAIKADIEDRTDRAALAAYDVLDDAEIEQLLDALTPLARAVVATGDIPAVVPNGFRFVE